MQRISWPLLALAVVLLAGGLLIGLRLSGGGWPVESLPTFEPDEPLQALSAVAIEIGSEAGNARLQLAVGEESRLWVETELEDGSQRRDAPVVWSSSNPQVAAIGPDGTLLAHSPGRATVRADLSPLSAEIEVTVDG